MMMTFNKILMTYLSTTLDRQKKKEEVWRHTYLQQWRLKHSPWDCLMLNGKYTSKFCPKALEGEAWDYIDCVYTKPIKER